MKKEMIFFYDFDYLNFMKIKYRKYDINFLLAYKYSIILVDKLCIAYLLLLYCYFFFDKYRFDIFKNLKFYEYFTSFGF